MKPAKATMSSSAVASDFFGVLRIPGAPNISSVLWIVTCHDGRLHALAEDGSEDPFSRLVPPNSFVDRVKNRCLTGFLWLSECTDL